MGLNRRLSMIHSSEIWDIIQTYMPRRQFIPFETIYEMVEEHGDLDAEDFEWQSTTSNVPKWR